MAAAISWIGCLRYNFKRRVPSLTILTARAGCPVRVIDMWRDNDQFQLHVEEASLMWPKAAFLGGDHRLGQRGWTSLLLRRLNEILCLKRCGAKAPAHKSVGGVCPPQTRGESNDTQSRSLVCPLLSSH